MNSQKILYLALKDKLWGIFREILGENISLDI